jgi:hypothetical protein
MIPTEKGSRAIGRGMSGDLPLSFPEEAKTLYVGVGS